MNIQELIDRLPAADDVAGRLGLRTQTAAVDRIAFGLPAAFALGAVAGVAAALLAAPRPGEQLRADLRRGVDETLRTLRERLAPLVAPAERSATKPAAEEPA